MGLRRTARLFVLISVAVFPTLAMLALADAWIASLPTVGAGAVRVAVVIIAVAWAAAVASLGSSFVGDDTRMLIDAAEQRGAESDDATIGRLGDLLHQRDLQLQRLAAQAVAAPVTAGPAAVADHVVRMAREVTTDQTWTLVIHGGGDELAPGVYDGAPGPRGAITDLHQWAVVTGSDQPALPTVAAGPWGAFLLLRLPGESGYRAQLMAPWEGRPEPSATERNLLSLMAQHAGVTLHDATLYARSTAQAAELARLSAVQADFLRGVTHDLQSPLATISATAADLGDRHELASATDELQTIRDQADRLRRMVTQLLTMSGLEAGVVRPRADVFRAGPIIDRVIRSLRLPAGSIVHTADGPDRLVVGDPDRFEQVLWALVDNAIKYSPGGGAVRIETTVVESAGSTYEEVAVVDEGIGMDAETLEHAFDQFYRSETARRVAPNGSGIGLYTARGLVELMGGSVTARSSPGAGTRISLRLPAELVHTPGAGPA